MTDSSCPLCRSRYNSRLIVPNFALQHVVAEGAEGHGSSVALAGGPRHGGFDLQRGSSNADVAAAYREFGVPPQLAEALAEEDHSIALRVYIMDNSGSMNAADGQILMPDTSRGPGGMIARPSTRWDELKHMVMEHAEWNAKVGVPSEFVLLNGSPSSINRIDAQRGRTEDQVRDLVNLLNRSHPGGTTPLTERLQDLRKRLRVSAPELQKEGRKLMLILVTDGVPNGSRHEFASSIRMLAKELSIHVVVRLCTNDDGVSEFYHEVDKELELSLDILDDVQHEAWTCYRLNPWLTYPRVLHTVREAGTLCKLLDYVDERALTPMEVGLCAQLLLRGEGQEKYPWQPEALLAAVEKDLASAPSVFCMKRRVVCPILNINAVRAALLPSKYSVTGQVASAVGLGGVADAWYEGRTLWDAFQHPKVAQVAPAASGPPSAPQCAICTRSTDGVFPHCCRTCQQSGGKQHGPTCERRQAPPPMAPPGGDEILKLGAVPEGCCFVCARATDGIFPHCCRTCEQSGGTRHGPACEARHAAVGFPQAKGGKGSKCAVSAQGGRGGDAGKGRHNGGEDLNSNQAPNAGYN